MQLERKVEKRHGADLQPDPEQVRKGYGDEEEGRRLGKSVKKKQHYPLLIQSANIIIDGHRRWWWGTQEGVEFFDVLVVEGSLSRDSLLEIMLVAALHKSDLTPYEQALAYKDWLEMNPGKTAKDLAERIDRDQSLISKYRSLFDCVTPIQEAAAEGRLGVTDWHPISHLPPQDQLGLLNLKLSGASREEIKEAARRKRSQSTATPVAKANRIKIDLASGATVTIVRKDLSLDDAVQALADAQKRLRIGRDQGLTARTISKVSSEVAKKGE